MRPPPAKLFPPVLILLILNQPQKVWIKALLEQDTPQDEAFVHDNMERFRRNELRGKSANKEDYGFYDITAWSLPLAFGVDAFWTEDAGNVNANVVTDDYLISQKAGNVSGTAQIAYVFPYETDAAAVLRFKAFEGRFSRFRHDRTLNAGGRNYKEGTFVVRVSRNIRQRSRCGQKSRA